jgi:hypothetical protein
MANQYKAPSATAMARPPRMNSASQKAQADANSASATKMLRAEHARQTSRNVTTGYESPWKPIR